MTNRLPQEMVEEILRRLLVKSLVKFTSVCKAWNSLITDQNFISDHLNRTIQASSKGKESPFLQFCLSPGKVMQSLHQEDFYSFYSLSQHHTNPFSVERFPLSHLFNPSHQTPFAGTCNGLAFAADFAPLRSPTILIWNPLPKKYLVLPKPIKTSEEDDESCNGCKHDVHFGFGFDSKKNNYKFVRVMLPVQKQVIPHIDFSFLENY